MRAISTLARAKLRPHDNQWHTAATETSMYSTDSKFLSPFLLLPLLVLPLPYQAHSIGVYQALPGHIFGETLLRNQKEEKQLGAPKWPYSVVATIPTQIYIISKAEFIRFLGGTPTAKALKVMASEQREQMVRRLDRMQKRIVECHELVQGVVPLSTAMGVGTATRTMQVRNF